MVVVVCVCVCAFVRACSGGVECVRACRAVPCGVVVVVVVVLD